MRENRSVTATDLLSCYHRNALVGFRLLRLKRHIHQAFEDFQRGDVDSALMNSCFAIDSTAKKTFGMGGAVNYKRLIRKYIWIIQFMVGGGFDLEKTIFSNLIIPDRKGVPISAPDIADLVYHIYRCNNAHGEDVPERFSLVKSSDGYAVTMLAPDSIMLPDRMVWALLSVSVFSSINADIEDHSKYYFTWGSENLGLGLNKFPLSEWWGAEARFREFVDSHELITIHAHELQRLNGLP